MASIMPFPNVATHRRLPHLQSHKEVAPQKIPLDGTTTTTAAATTTHIQHSRSQDQADSHLQLTGPDSKKNNLLLSNDGTKNSSQSAKKLLQDGHSQSDASSKLSPQASSTPRSSTSPPLSSHDSKMIKTAIYDAFGVLYHPSAHTKHSLSTAAAALRSGEVTPLMGVSPGGSPLLQPQPGTSAPITPLELSDESTAPGYFGLQISSSSVSSSGTGAPSSSHHALHPYSRHHHHHTSSHLNQTFTPEHTSSGHRSGFSSPLSLSRRSSVDHRSSIDYSKDPEHHPVLSSLQSLSLTHPPQHYHPHLGHDLGHDKVSINPPDVAKEPSVKQVTTQEPTESAKASERVATLPPKPSLFPMDQGDSISQFGNEQGLI